MSDAVRHGRRRVVVWTVTLAVAFAFLSWVIGVSVLQSLLLGTAVTAIGAVLLTVGDLEDEPGLPPLEQTGQREGARREVSRLSWVMSGNDRRVGDLPHRRLRAIAVNRLSLRGIDVAEPAGDAAARELLGPVGYATLIEDTNSRPNERVFEACVTLLERLDEPPEEPAEMSNPAPEVPALTVTEVAGFCDEVLTEVGTVVVGMRTALRTALAAILAGGHVLFEDVPGLGKTLAARSLATALGLEFRRLQCTPDLLPADITGSYIYDPAGAEFVFRPGPVFTGLFLADEINRTAPKTQSALLEAMAERQVTVEGNSFLLNRPFHVMATSNPVEYEGTYPLPEAQLDRFMVRLAVGYPDREAETDVLTRRLARRTEEASVRPVVEPETVLAMQAGVEAVQVDLDVTRYCVDLAASTRHHQAVEVGASPRGSQALVLVSRALAVLSGRDYVTPEDVKEIAVSALAHRLTLTPQTWATGLQPADVVRNLLDTVPGPTTTASTARA